MESLPADQFLAVDHKQDKQFKITLVYNILKAREAFALNSQILYELKSLVQNEHYS